MEVKEMPDYYELEERLTKVEVKANRLRYGAFPSLEEELKQARKELADLFKRVTELEGNGESDGV
jgi:predicted nuclease with TOPRIM domain